MKTLVLIFLLAPFVGFSQIQVMPKTQEITIGKVKRGGQFVAEIKQEIKDGDTLYFYMFQNAKYSTITDFQIIHFEGKKTLDDLYTLLMSVFLEENKKNKEYKVDFNLGKSYCSIKTERMMGLTAVWFYTDKGYNSYTEKEINKLFGK